MEFLTFLGSEESVIDSPRASADAISSGSWILTEAIGSVLSVG